MDEGVELLRQVPHAEFPSVSLLLEVKEPVVSLPCSVALLMQEATSLHTAINMLAEGVPSPVHGVVRTSADSSSELQISTSEKHAARQGKQHAPPLAADKVGPAPDDESRRELKVLREQKVKQELERVKQEEREQATENAKRRKENEQIEQRELEKEKRREQEREEALGREKTRDAKELRTEEAMKAREQQLEHKRTEVVQEGLAKTVHEEIVAAGGAMEGVRALREQKGLISFRDRNTDSTILMRALPDEGKVEVCVNGWCTCTANIKISGDSVSLPNGSRWAVSLESIEAIVKTAKDAHVEVEYSEGATSVPRTARSVSVARQKEYIRHHRVHVMLGASLDQCLKEMPPDPYFYIASSLLRQANKEPAAPKQPVGAWEAFPECRIISLESEVRKLQQTLTQTRIEHELEREVCDLREQVLRMSRPGSAPPRV